MEERSDTRELRSTPPLVLIREDSALVQAVEARLSKEGWKARRCGAGALAQALREADAETVLILVPQDEAELEAMGRTVARWQGAVAAPVIYISRQDDMAGRLAAQRVGATRYLTHPVDLDRLMLLLDAHLLRLPEAACRVLLVEEDAERLHQHAAALEAEAMEVEALSDPLAAHTAAVRFRPECIVLERAMAGVAGDVLAAVFRADARFQDTPIVYLMPAAGGGQPLPQLEGGGETCLPLAVDVGVLAACIRTRVRRARSLRRLNEDLRAALRESRMLRLALDMHTLVCITDAAGSIAYVNDAFCRACGYKRRELLGQGIGMLKSGVHPPEFYREFWQTLLGGEVWQGRFCNRRKDGSLYWVDTTVLPYQEDRGRPARYLSVGTEVTRLVALEQALQRIEAEGKDLGAGFARTLGPPLKVMLGLVQSLAIHPALAAELKDDVQALLHTGRSLLDEFDRLQSQVPPQPT